MAKQSRAKPPVVPCEFGSALKSQIEDFAEVLRTQAHTLGSHGMTEEEFYASGLLPGAIQRIRGQYSSTMLGKRDFVARVLRHMEDNGHIDEWESAGGKNRFDYTVKMKDGKTAVIELKGCLDGNNTVIFERPSHAQEFIIWSVCKNESADPRKNVWSGIHTRLGPEMIENSKQVDGLVVWDWLCGSPFRPCPKLLRYKDREVVLDQFKLPPPCIYLFPQTIPSVRNNPNPEPHKLENVSFLAALNACFGGYLDEVSKVRYKVGHQGGATVRTTSVERGGKVQQHSRPQPIRRR